MTSSSKKVTRVTDISYPVLTRKPKRIVVQIFGEVIRFRAARSRRWFSLPIDDVFNIAVKCSSGFRLHMVPDSVFFKSLKKARRSKL
jgi:hypothetical protein